MTKEEIPFIRAILTSPKDFSNRLVYADWLEERGDPRAEYLRVWATFNQAADAGEPTKGYGARLQKLHIHGHWMSFVHCWEPRKEVDEDDIVLPWAFRKSDADLQYGPCFICGRSKNMRHWVSRMPCEKCNRVFCWECADTGVHGSPCDCSIISRHQMIGNFIHLEQFKWPVIGFRVSFWNQLAKLPAPAA